MEKRNKYPHWAHKTQKEWLRDVRKRWAFFRKRFNGADNVFLGCAFYPDEVREWLHEFEKMDTKMKEFYKNA